VIHTDINTLISANLDWRQRDQQFDKAFDRDRTILAVVDAPTPEQTSARLRARAEAQGDRPTSSPAAARLGQFFDKKACCFCRPRGRLRSRPVRCAAPLIEIMAGRSLIRGLTGALETGLARRQAREVKLDQYRAPFNMIRRRSRTFSTRQSQFLLARADQHTPLTDATGVPSSSSSRCSIITR